MDDYIPRLAAIKAVCDACGVMPDDEKDNCQYKFTGCKEFYNIFTTPPAEVLPIVRGCWKLKQTWVEKVGQHWNIWYCSECNDRYSADWEYRQDGKRPRKNFCPNCGADMRGG